MDRSRYERLEYTDLAASFIDTGGDWGSSKPRVYAFDSSQHHFALDFGSKQVEVVCSEVRIEEFLLPQGEESSEGIGLEDGTIRYVDLRKRDNVLVSKIRQESAQRLIDRKVRELWFVIFCQSHMVRLGDYLYAGAHNSSSAIINARDYVRAHGAGSFDRIYFFSLPSRTADYVGPFAGALTNSALEWRVFEYSELGFRIELPGQPVVREEEFEGDTEFKSVSLELSFEGILINLAWTGHWKSRDLESAIEQLKGTAVEIYNLPVLDSRALIWKGHSAADLRMGQPGHYVSARMIVAPKRTLVALVDSQFPLDDSAIATRVLDSIALL